MFVNAIAFAHGKSFQLNLMYLGVGTGVYLKAPEICYTLVGSTLHSFS